MSPPSGWSFEPEEVELKVDGEKDPCFLGHDINFHFEGFAVVGKVYFVMIFYKVFQQIVFNKNSNVFIENITSEYFV